MPDESVLVDPEVRDALSAGRPVVALETAVLTCGLPSTPAPPDTVRHVEGWRADAPANLEAARLMESRVRTAGSVPATIGVLGGRLRIGMTTAERERLGESGAGCKAAVGTLAAALAGGGSAGTTVSATLHACRLASTEGRTIRVMATGGIGGVHRGLTTRPDVSADLPLLGRTPVAVVCSGAKSILDIPATLEALETLGVAVVGYGTDRFPMFHSDGRADLPVPHRVDTVPALAAFCRSHVEIARLDAAVLVAQPVPAAAALDPDEVEELVDAALVEAGAHGIAGAAVTPFLLSRITARTGGRSLVANLALLARNASLAGELAMELAADA